MIHSYSYKYIAPSSVTTDTWEVLLLDTNSTIDSERHLFNGASYKVFHQTHYNLLPILMNVAGLLLRTIPLVLESRAQLCNSWIAESGLQATPIRWQRARGWFSVWSDVPRKKVIFRSTHFGYGYDFWNWAHLRCMLNTRRPRKQRLRIWLMRKSAEEH